MLKQATTLLKKDHLWIFNKQAKQHYNELLKGHSEENKWKSVHRLDYETSGAICYARQDIADQFTKLFKERGAKKFYIAGASKKISDTAISSKNNQGVAVSGFIASKYRHSTKVKFLLSPNEWYRTNSPVQHTLYDLSDKSLARSIDPQLNEEVLQEISTNFEGYPYLVHLVTGARHQIRAYFKFMNAPLVGDPIYGAADESSRLELHSWKIEMKDPVDGMIISAIAPIEKRIK